MSVFVTGALRLCDGTVTMSNPDAKRETAGPHMRTAKPPSAVPSSTVLEVG